MALVDQLADAVFSYPRIIMASAPVLWLALDRAAAAWRPEERQKGTWG